MKELKQSPAALHSCYIDIMEGKRRVITMGEGHAAVEEFAEYAKKGGKLRARSISRLPHNNFEVQISGITLILFLSRYYPAVHTAEAGKLAPDKQYRIVCCDLSEI